MKNDAVIIQQIYPDLSYLGILNAVEPHHQAYADRHKMDYSITIGNVREDWPFNKGGWAKLLLIRGALVKYRYVIYLDTDAVIADMNCDLRAACMQHLVGAVIYDDVQPPYYNAGVLYFKKSSRVLDFLDDWISRYPGPQPGWEQAVLNLMASEEKWFSVVGRLDERYNALYGSYADPFVVAWHSLGTVAEKTAWIMRFLKDENK